MNAGALLGTERAISWSSTLKIPTDGLYSGLEHLWFPVHDDY